jgi:hypothetical protein
MQIGSSGHFLDAGNATREGTGHQRRDEPAPIFSRRAYVRDGGAVLGGEPASLAQELCVGGAAFQALLGGAAPQRPGADRAERDAGIAADTPRNIEC